MEAQSGKIKKVREIKLQSFIIIINIDRKVLPFFFFFLFTGLGFTALWFYSF